MKQATARLVAERKAVNALADAAPAEPAVDERDEAADEQHDQQPDPLEAFWDEIEKRAPRADQKRPRTAHAQDSVQSSWRRVPNEHQAMLLG